MAKTKKKLKMRRIILLLLIILIIVLVAYIILSNKESKKSLNKLAYINSTEWNNEVYPEGMPAFVRAYSGSQTAQNMGKSIYYVVTEVIPKYIKTLKDFTSEELREYYYENEKTIEVELGIANEIDFVNLVKDLKKLKTTDFKLESFYIDENTIRIESNSTKASLYIKYKGCEEFEITIRAYNIIKSGVSSVKYYSY